MMADFVLFGIVISVFRVQLTRKVKEMPVKNVNILKLMTLKTNGLSYVFTLCLCVFVFVFFVLTIHTSAQSEHFSRNILSYLLQFYVVAGITVAAANVNFVYPLEQ